MTSIRQKISGPGQLGASGPTELQVWLGAGSAMDATTSSGTVEERKTRTSVYTRRADGIIVQAPLEGTAQSLEDARENVAAFTALAGGQKMPLLVDGRASFQLKAGVREYYSSPAATRYTSAIALLIGSAAMRVITNLFLTMNKPVLPTRSFTKHEDAVAWLHRVRRAEREG